MLCYVWAIVAVFYGISSVEILRLVKIDITAFDNIWPRLIFNSLPATFFGYWYKNSKRNVAFKAYSSAIVLPGLLASAALVYAWPLFWQGNYDLYLYFTPRKHIRIFNSASNIIGNISNNTCANIGFFHNILVSSSIHAFSKCKSRIIINLIINDFAFVVAIFLPALYSLNKLRDKFATADLKIKEMTASFLGNPLTRAIFCW